MLSLVLVAVVFVMCALGAVSWLSRQSDVYVPVDEYGQSEDEAAADGPVWDWEWTELDGSELSWSMPLVDDEDGPGALDAIALPALGTFWSVGPTDAGLVYHATLLQDLGALGADADLRARAAIAALHPEDALTLGAPTPPSERGPAVVHDDVAEFDLERVGDDRVFLGRVYAWDEHVFVLEVGRPEGRLELEGQATFDLGRMIESVDFVDP